MLSRDVLVFAALSSLARAYFFARITEAVLSLNREALHAHDEPTTAVFTTLANIQATKVHPPLKSTPHATLSTRPAQDDLPV